MKDLMIGLRRHEKASLMVTHCRAVSGKMRGDVREISHVHTMDGFRKLGHASKLLREVCEEADRMGMLLLVFPKPYGDGEIIDEGQLIDWYCDRFDFQMIQTVPVKMLARPAIPVELRRRMNKNRQIILENSDEC